ncbi:MAG: hypothetical protein AAF108_10375 [Planctomycetota bacterium]
MKLLHIGCVVAAALSIGVTTPTPAESGVSVLLPPEPSPLPLRWEFDLRIGPLRLATIPDDQGVSRSYFYLTYAVTNRTGEDRPFTPSWTLTTDTGRVYRSGRGVPMEATRRLVEAQDNPYLEDQISILGRLQQGRINAKEGIVVWPAQDLTIDELRVYASGFSGESTRLTTIDPETGQEQQFVLRKTRMVRYEVPGNLFNASGREIKPTEFRWIMR